VDLVDLAVPVPFALEKLGDLLGGKADGGVAAEIEDVQSGFSNFGSSISPNPATKFRFSRSQTILYTSAGQTSLFFQPVTTRRRLLVISTHIQTLD